MAEVGKASLTIVPKTDGLKRQIEEALSGVDAAGAGRELGRSYSGGMTSAMGSLKGAGALVGAFASMTSKAMDVVSSHIDAAVSRVDTLNNYPKVMSSLGIAADESTASINLMSDRLSSLPTRLDAMVSSTQQVYVASKSMGVSLGDATEAALGLNDMLLAGGQGSEVAEAAMTQFTQALSKGKPDLEDFRALVSAAPAQMDQLAQSMLGPTAGTNDLYEALKGGKVSMKDMLDAITELDKNGGSGFASFADQAEAATGGLQTAMSNMQNAVTKGVANVIKAVGTDNITSVLNDVKGGINDAFSYATSLVSSNRGEFAGIWTDVKSAAREGGELVRKVVDGALPIAKQLVPQIKTALSIVKQLAPAALAVSTALKGWSAASGAMSKVFGVAKGAGSALGGLSDKLTALSKASSSMDAGFFSKLAGGASTLGTALQGPLGVGLTVAAVGIAALVGYESSLRQAQEDATTAVDDFNAAVADSSGLQTYSTTLSGVGQAARDTTDHLATMTSNWQQHADTMRQNNETAEGTIGTWATVQATLDNLIGKTGLTTQEQGQLRWALDQVNDATGEQITLEDALTGKYQDQNGEVQNLRDMVDDLAQSKINEARTGAISANLTEAYKAQSDAAGELAQAQDQYNGIYQKYLDDANAGKYQLNGLTAEEFARTAALEEAATTMVDVDGEQRRLSDVMNDAQRHYDDATKAIETNQQALGDAANAAANADDAYAQLAVTDVLASATFQRNGHSMDDVVASLRNLGADTVAFGQLSAEQLTTLASHYDGTGASIVQDLADMGVGMSDSAQAAAESTAQIRDSLNGMGASDALSTLGMDVGTFAEQLTTAGVTSADMSGITSEQFATMAANCGGSVDALIASIALYNAEPLYDKETATYADSAQLIDAQGHVWTWNGTQVVDKNGVAAADDTLLMDAQGNVYVWNSTKMDSHEAMCRVTGNGADGSAQGEVVGTGKAVSDLKSNSVEAAVTGNASDGTAATHIWDTVSAIGSLVGKHIENTITTIKETITRGSAAGGIRLNAAGGLRLHAAGASIVTRATPLDIVGEDGAEAIVPLTNRRYSQPFADVIAEEVAGRTGGDQSALLQEVRALAAKLDRVGVYLDGRRLAGYMAPDIDRELGQLREAYAR